MSYTTYRVADEHGVRWVIADRGWGWLPGNYDSEAAARAATTLPHGRLVQLAERICHQRPITIADVEAAR